VQVALGVYAIIQDATPENQALVSAAARAQEPGGRWHPLPVAHRRNIDPAALLEAQSIMRRFKVVPI